MKYIVLRDYNVGELEKRVEHMLGMGYVLQGGIAFVENPLIGKTEMSCLWAQAMIKP